MVSIKESMNMQDIKERADAMRKGNPNLDFLLRSNSQTGVVRLFEYMIDQEDYSEEQESEILDFLIKQYS